MTKSQLAKVVLHLVQIEEHQTQRELVNCHVQWAGAVAEEKCYAKDSDDLGPGLNRYAYATEKAKEAFKRAQVASDEWVEVLAFATDHFLSMIPDTKGADNARDHCGAPGHGHSG